MADITVERPMTSEQVQPLREQVRGQVVTATDEGYNEARAVHNGMFTNTRWLYCAPSRSLTSSPP